MGTPLPVAVVEAARCWVNLADASTESFPPGLVAEGEQHASSLRSTWRSYGLDLSNLDQVIGFVVGALWAGPDPTTPDATTDLITKAILLVGAIPLVRKIAEGS